jgi:transcriptional regulator with AAA-type ATPase domain/tetratricopeptide (TPR) repeat protein
VFEQLLGDSPAITELRGDLRRLLARPAGTSRRLPPVLIEGETGTGKGLVASAIHAEGPRAAASFVDVNCAAIPETLLEAELFGYERGAFTDARQAKPGLFQVAHRGTIFLDEIGLMPDALQVKLLKALEDHAVRRLGATRSEPADAWVIAATSEDLKTAIRNRRFREDLYHRLAVVTLRLPPLRERGDDVLLLARHYLRRVCSDYGLPAKTLAADATAALLGYAWPGNVRELANLMERVALLADAGEIAASSLRLPRPARVGPSSSRSSQRIDDQLGAFERDRIEEALRIEAGNISRAAARLGLPRNTFRYRMARHGLAEEPDAPVRAAPVVAATASSAAASTAVRWQRARVTFLQADVVPRDVLPEHEQAAAVDRMAEKIRAFGGRILDVRPAGILAAFGLDVAEDAARHAAHAALAVHRVSGGRAGAANLRIALHTEEARVGSLDERVEVEGDARLAAQQLLDELIAAATEAQIVASASAKTFLDRHFTLTATPQGEAAPWEIVGLAGGNPRSTPFVSRDRELALLDQLLAQVEAGGGHSVLVIGDAGIGKTRLMREFERRTTDRATWLRGSAVSFGSSLPFHPLIDLLKHALSIQPNDSDQVIRERIDTITAAFGEPFRDAVPFLRALMSLDMDDVVLTRIDPKLRRVGMFDALTRFLHAMAGIRPVVVVLEDVHWMDPATGEFLALIAERLSASRILLCVTQRTGYAPPFPATMFGTQVMLGSVSRTDTAAIGSAVLGGSMLAVDLQQLLADVTDGNPFFIEEVLRSLQDSDSLGRRDGVVSLRRPPQRVEVPMRVEDVLRGRMARLERGPREALGVAAVIGRQFTRRVLERVLPDTSRLDDSLGALRAAQLIQVAGVWPEASYVFKHALTQEVAYAAQPAAERQTLHARIGQAIQEIYAGRLSEYLGVLAHHFFEAEHWDQALTYQLAAAEQAERTFAAREALALYDEALQSAHRRGGGAGDLDTQIAIHDARARLYFVTSDFARSAAEGERILPLARLTSNRLKEAEALATIGWASLWGRNYEEAMRFSRDALAVAEPIGAVAVQGRAQYTIGFANAVIGMLEESHVAIDRAIDISSAAGDTVHQSLALSAAGLLRNWTGDYAEAARLQAEGHALAEQRGLLLPRLFSSFLRGLTLTGKGDYDDALATFSDGLLLAERVGDEAIHHRLLNCLGWLYADLGDLEQAQALNEESARVGRRRHDPGTQPNAELNLAEIFFARGELDRAQDQYDGVFRYWKNPPSQWMRFRYSIRMFAGMGALALARGDVVAAQAHNAQAIDLATRAGSRKNLVKTWRLAGTIALATADPSTGEYHLRQARDLAVRLGNPVQHWKSEVTLGDFLRHAGRDEEAQQAFGRAWSVMQAVRDALGDERLRRAFEKNADVLFVQRLVAGVHSN